MTEPTGEGIPVQYRFVADEHTADQYARAALRLTGVRRAVVAACGLVFFAGTSLLGMVALRDVAVGWDGVLGGCIVGLVATAAFFALIRRVGFFINRWFFGRHWQPGTVLETGFGQNGMLLARNGNPRLVSYADVSRVVRTQAMAQVILVFGAIEYFPRGLFPDDAMQLLNTGRKAGRRLPPAPVTIEGEVTEFVVPPGWANTVAGTFLRVALTRPGTYVRLAAFEAALLAGVAIGWSWWWLLLPPVLITLALTRGYVGSRRRFAVGQPEGAVLSVTAGQDRFALQRPTRTDVFAYADVRRVHRRDEVSVLLIAGYRNVWMLPTALLPQQLAS